MASSPPLQPEAAPPAPRRFGVRGRLLLAFVGIAAFGALAAGAGIFAFREVGARFEIVDQRVTPTVLALELSRSAERIIASAPALLAAADRADRDAVKDRLAVQKAQLEASLHRLEVGQPTILQRGELEPLVAALTGKLDALDELVARRLDTADRIAQWRDELFGASADVERLLTPWRQITDVEIALALQAEGGPDPDGFIIRQQKLRSLITLQQRTRAAQEKFSAAVDLLAEASSTRRPERLAILDFQIGLAVDDLRELAGDLDAKLEPVFLEQVQRLDNFASEPNAMVEARGEELELIGAGEALLGETADLSGRLSGAVDRLAAAAQADIGNAVADAVAVQQVGGRVLVALAVLSLVSSGLIVWLYVGGNIVRRLTALSTSMLAITGGDFRTPIVVRGSDEIAAMGRVAERLRRNTQERDELLAERASAADRLEVEVKQRTAELEVANAFKSRFLAAASHDLRQPLHALNLFVAQLRGEADPTERAALEGRIESAVGSMNELFEALLDMSKLDAGILEPDLREFAAEDLLKRIEATLSEPARQKKLRLRVLACSAWVESDFILLERILLNLAANAVRYTESGGVVVGCRRRGAYLRFDVCDSGPGIPFERQRTIFEEFYQIPAKRADRTASLGLGLAIVEGLAGLLKHPIELDSKPGRGSRFSVLVPVGENRADAAAHHAVDPPTGVADVLAGKVVMVIDDDPLVLEGMGGILRQWGCAVIAAPGAADAVGQLKQSSARLDLIVCDYKLAGQQTGIEAIDAVRLAAGAEVPAFLITGDTAPNRLREATASGYRLLSKPVTPMALRALMTRMLERPSDDAPPAAGRSGKANRRRNAGPETVFQPR